ncbi:MAG TPA: FtsW/RodA/SpoVE family cell cycle protein, partial [Desulfosporosinus sp.]|nr:FtsW/RodA/SpoVE family cell cycle protein [Desulfosporosinus sp.]
MDRRTLKNMDFLFILVTLLLLAASLFILSTASINVDKTSPLHYFKVQAYWIMSGIGIAGVLAAIDYQKWRRLRWWIYGINIFLLMLVIIFGSTVKGATRWIPITSTIQIQPSEFAKIFIIITLADFLA